MSATRIQEFEKSASDRLAEVRTRLEAAPGALTELELVAMQAELDEIEAEADALTAAHIARAA